VIRAARPDDVPVLVSFVRELATYEKAESEVELDEPQLHAVLFAPEPKAFCLVATPDDGDEPVGFAVWFVTFSTWLGRHGIYLEDLYVREQHRRGGHGRALLAALAQICVERGYGRLEWSVLDWNAPAIAFYQAIGATAQDEWTVHRLSGAALASLGSEPIAPR
jgi:GNAT superfamily N-acetyltransferase